VSALMVYEVYKGYVSSCMKVHIQTSRLSILRFYSYLVFL